MKKLLEDTRFSNHVKTWLPTLLLLGLSLVRLVGLDGGLVLGEPDEFIHQAVAESFKESSWPVYNNAPWFFQLPLYPYLGYLLQGFFPQRYVALRIVSVVSSILLILATYYFLSRFFSKRAGFLAALLMVLSPFSIYISRLALLDSTVVAFGLVALYFQELALKEKRIVWSVFAGLTLSLAIMVKYTALIYLLAFIFLSVVFLLKDNKTNFLKTGVLNLRSLTLVPLIITGFLVIPLMFLLRSHDSYFFKIQFFTSLGFIRDFWRIKGGELNVLYYWREMPWWLTWPVFVLFIGGLFTAIMNVRKFPVFFLGFVLTVAIAGPFRPFYPRYFYPFVPFVVVLAGLFLDGIFDRFGRRVSLTILGLVIVVMLPTSVEAFRSTQHVLVEETVRAVAKSQKKNPWIFTNYWPNFFTIPGVSAKITWLSESQWDASAYAPDINNSPTEILKKEGGIVLLEKNYSNSKIFISPEVRLRAENLISQKYPITVSIIDGAPNFPHFRNSHNQINLYFIEP